MWPQYLLHLSFRDNFVYTAGGEAGDWLPRHSSHAGRNADKLEENKYYDKCAQSAVTRPGGGRVAFFECGRYDSIIIVISQKITELLWLTRLL